MNLHHFQWKRTHFFCVFLFATNFSQVTLSVNDLQAKICDVVWIALGKIKQEQNKKISKHSLHVIKCNSLSSPN